jgi:type III secretion protein J
VRILDGASIAALKVREPSGGRAPRYRVEVATSEAARAIAVLDAHTLPGDPQREGEPAHSEPSLVPTLADEEAHQRVLLEASLARSLRSLDGVVDARVHLAMPSRTRPLDGPAGKPRASVLVRRLANASPLDATQLRALIAAAVTDLNAADVAVTQDAVTPVEPQRQLAHVGPIAVSAASERPLRLLLGGLLALNLVLAIGLIALLRRGTPR